MKRALAHLIDELELFLNIEATCGAVKVYRRFDFFIEMNFHLPLWIKLDDLKPIGFDDGHKRNIVMFQHRMFSGNKGTFL